jgi:type I restriction enzyme S subunit
MISTAGMPLEEIMPPRLGTVDPAAYPDEDFDLYSIPAFDLGEPEALKGREIGSAKQIVQPGDILLSRIVPHIRRAWVVGGSRGRRIIASGEWIVFRGARVDPQYLRHVLLGNPFHAEFMRTVSGVGGSLLRARPAYVAKIRIPLPPLPEQRRIAKTLDNAEALRRKRSATVAQLEILTRSIFLDMFGEPATNPKGWPVSPIGEVTECLDRLRRPVTESDRKPGGVPYYGANGQQGWIDSALFDEPLVLVAEDGGYFDTPGRGVAYRIDGPAWVNNHAHVLRGLPQFVETEFLHRVLQHYNFRPYISGTTRAKLTQGQMNSAKLIIPPLPLQRQFGEQVVAARRLEGYVISSRDRLDELFALIQQRAFRGEL